MPEFATPDYWETSVNGCGGDVYDGGFEKCVEENMEMLATMNGDDLLCEYYQNNEVEIPLDKREECIYTRITPSLLNRNGGSVKINVKNGMNIEFIDMDDVDI